MSNFDLAQLIRQRAYQRWEARGSEHGNSDENWFEAEREIKALDAMVEDELKKNAQHETNAGQAKEI